VCVNDAMLNYTALELPMGGWKESGLGADTARAASASTARSRRSSSSAWRRSGDIHMFPYKAKTTRLLGRALKFLYGRGKRA